MAKAGFRPANRTSVPVTGNITGITLDPASPIVSRGIANGTLVATASALSSIGAVTYVSGNPNFVFSGADLNRNGTGGTLTPSVTESVSITATDSRGPISALSATFSIGVYSLPSAISLTNVAGASGQNGQVLDSAANNTQIGTFATFGGKAPYSYLKLTNSKFSTGLDSNGAQSLVRNSTGTLTAGVSESVMVQVTDDNGETFIETFTITVASSIAPELNRFDPLPGPTQIVALTWNLAGDPTATPYPNWLREGVVGSWKAHSTDYPDIDGVLFSSVDDVRSWLIAPPAGKVGGPARLRFGILSNLYNYAGPFAAQIGSLGQRQSEAGLTEYICIEGLGNLDGGYGLTGVKLWDPPMLQLKHTSGNSGASDSCLLNLQEGVLCQSKYLIKNLRWGPFREEEAAAVAKAFNLQGATTAAECIKPSLVTCGYGLALIQAAAQVCIQHCEVFGQNISGLHSTKDLRALRYNASVQVLDSVFRNNGASDQHHNVYLGDTKHAVLLNNLFTNPTGHNCKFDNQQSFEIGENAISGYDERYIKYVRTTNPKLFVGNSGQYEAALRKVPASAPFTIDIYSYVDNVTAVDVNGIPTATQDPYYDPTLGTGASLTVVTTAPLAGQVKLDIVGDHSTNEANNASVATFTFNAADHDKWVRIPGRGFHLLRKDTQGGGISVDNPNQDFSVWNNMFHPLHYSGDTPALIYIQGRHQGADLRHHKHPPYTYQSAALDSEIKMSSVLSGLDASGDAAPPKTFTGYLSAALGGLNYTLFQCDFIYGDVTVIGGELNPLTQGTVVDVQVRCDDGFIHTTQMTLTTFIKEYNGHTKDFNVTLVANPVGHTISGGVNNVVVLKLTTTPTWDSPKMDAPDQACWFDPNNAHYWFKDVMVDFAEGTTVGRQLDFSKQTPDGINRRWGFPFGSVFDNFAVNLVNPTPLIEPITYKLGCFVQSLNTTWCTKQVRDGDSYDCRLAYPPLSGPWASTARAGNFNWQLKQTTALGGYLYGTDGSGGVGILNSDMVRPNAVVLRRNLVNDFHIPTAGKFEAIAKVGNTSCKNTILNNADMLADIRVIPHDLTSVTDINDTVKLTVNEKTSWPASVDRGSPFLCLTGINVNDTFVDRCTIQTQVGSLTDPFKTSTATPHLIKVKQVGHGLVVGKKVRFLTVATTVGSLNMTGDWIVDGIIDKDNYSFTHTGSANANVAAGGGAVTYTFVPQVDDDVAFEVDSQMGPGNGSHIANITAVTPNGANFDIIWAPGLPQPADVGLGYEKALPVYTGTRNGGHGAFARPARPWPNWHEDPYEQPD
jgi:hypothetical protein